MADPSSSSGSGARTVLILVGIAVLGIVAVPLGIGALLAHSLPHVQVPIADVPARVLRSTDGGVATLRLDWTVPGAPRAVCYLPVSGQARVERADGGLAQGAKLWLLWGSDFATGPVSVEGGSADLEAWPCRPGTPHVFASDGERGAAELPCGTTGRGEDAHFLCTGKLDPAARLVTPTAPPCPRDSLTPAFDLLAPGLCLGVSEEDATRGPQRAELISDKAKDEVQVESPTRAQVRLEFNPAQPGRPTQVTAKFSGDQGPALEKVVAALKAALGEPKVDKPLVCAGSGGWSMEFNQSAVAQAFVKIRSRDCGLAALDHAELGLVPKSPVPGSRATIRGSGALQRTPLR